MHPTSPTATAPAASRPVADEAGLFRPERSWTEWLWAAVVFAVTALAYVPFLRCEAFWPDEGILLQGAQRILQGQVLYRDFFSFYTPGSYYGLALLFRLFGDSVITGRVALLLQGAAMAALTYLLARRVAARWAALLAAYAVVLLTLPFEFITLHNWDSTLLAYLALYAAVRWLERPHWISAGAVGFFAALTCLDEQSKGAGLVLGLAAAAIWLVRQPPWRPQLRPRQAWAAAGGVALPTLATAAYFARQGALGAMVADVLWPLRHYLAANSLPYGYMFFHAHIPATGSWLAKAEAWLWFSPHLAILLLPWIGVGVAAALWLGLRPHHPAGLARGYYLLVGTVMTGLLLSVVLTRQDYGHIAYLTPIFALAIAWFTGRRSPGPAARAAAPIVAAYVLLFFTLAGVHYWARALRGFPATVTTAHGRLRMAVPDPVLAYLRRLPPGPIFVYPYLPDYYYLSGRANPTRFAWLQWGQNSPRQFAAAQTELAATPPVAVLFDLGAVQWEAKNFPGMPVTSYSGARHLETYLLRRFHHCATMQAPPHRWAVLLPRGVPCLPAVGWPRLNGRIHGASRDHGALAPAARWLGGHAAAPARH